MKSVFLYQNLEFRLELPVDTVRQGDLLPCTLTVKNHSESPSPLAGVSLELAQGDLKRVKEKESDPFRVIESAELSAPAEEILGKGSAQLLWTFSLTINAPISDKASSLFLLFGDGAAASGWLQLTVLPHRYIESLTGVLESTFQFVLKGIKAAENGVVSKFKPPTDPRYSVVDELLLTARFEGDVLRLEYSFKVKKLDASTVNLAIRRSKMELSQDLLPPDYEIPGGYPHLDGFKAKLSEIFATF